MGLENMLLELTKGEVTGNIETLLDFVVDGRYTPFQELVKGCTSFHHKGAELLIYGGKNGTMSACITEYCDNKFITVMYDNTGLIYDSHFSYESEMNRCLYDLYDLKKHNPTSWVYNLTEIYDEYGLDTVNAASRLYDY